MKLDTQPQREFEDAISEVLRRNNIQDDNVTVRYIGSESAVPGFAFVPGPDLFILELSPDADTPQILEEIRGVFRSFDKHPFNDSDIRRRDGKLKILLKEAIL